MTRTSIYSIISGVFIVLLTSVSMAKPIELTAAHVNPPGEPCYEAFKFMSEKLKAGKTGISLKVFPQGQVGDEKDAVEQVNMGALTMTCVANANLSSFAPSIGIYDTPFLFRDGDKHPWIVTDGPIGQKITEKAEKESGLDILGWWSAGLRHVFTKKTDVKTPEDMKDMKIRVIGSPVYVDTFNQLGAKPVPMPYGEVYTGLATGTLDAAENDTSGYRNMKFFEQAPHLSLTGHVFLMKPVVANRAALEKLSPEQHKEFDAIFQEATKYQRELFATTFTKDIEWAKAHGVTVTEPDRAAFEEKVRPVQEKIAKQYGEALFQSIKDAK